MLRAFVGLALPEEIARSLAPVLAGLPAGRLVEPDMLHITLAFLGAQREPVIEDLHHLLEDIAAPPFALRLAGLGMFGEDRPRSLHAVVEPEPALAHLRRKVRAAARAAGIALARERFVPHVTLARFSGPPEPELLARLGAFVAGRAAFRSPPFAVEEFVLFRSTLRPAGSLYDPLAQYPLRG